MWTLRTLAIALAFSAGLALAQDSADPQLPANPQPQKPSVTQPPPRTAPSSSAPQPSPPAEKPPAGADAQTQTAAVLPAAAERHYHAARMAEKEKDNPNAITEYRAAIKEYPDSIDAPPHR